MSTGRVSHIRVSASRALPTLPANAPRDACILLTVNSMMNARMILPSQPTSRDADYAMNISRIISSSLRRSAQIPYSIECERRESNNQTGMIRDPTHLYR